jgi:tetratricopeptide (TPR) repeat protein
VTAAGQDGDGDATATGRFAADLPPGTILAGRFRLDRLLGIGGMGVVYRATDLQLGVPVAIKLLRSEMADKPGAFERFRQELLLSRQVSSPHVVRIHDIAQHEGRWLISMDLVEGEPLDKVLDREGGLPVERALAIARQVALGLAAAHARDVVHRDLKPANVLLTPEGNAYISDFGIARSLGTRGMTVTGTVVGTPDYLSPEQARAEPVDARSDLYALGLVLYEMLTGQPAYAGGTQSEAITQRLVGPPPPIRKKRADVPAWVERLLDRLLRSNPAHRPRDAEAVVRAIDARHVARDWRPGKRSLLVALSLLVAGALAALAWNRGAMPPLPVFSTPQRLVVLPVENATGDASLAPMAAAATEHLRQSLAGGALPVVDGERVEQALAQVGLPDAPAGALDLRALLRALPATRVLRPRLVHGTDGYALQATLGPRDSPPVRGPAAADVLAALRAFEPLALRAVAPGAKAAASTLPSSPAALAAHGRGLELRRAGRLDAAVAEFAAATRADPGYAAAWLAQAQSLLQAGMSERARDAAGTGARLPVARALRPAFQLVDALAGGAPGPALAALQARTKAQPDDLDAQLRLAQLQGQANALPQAIAGLRALLRRDEADPRAWFLLGKYSIMHGEISSAVDESLVRALVLYKRGRNRFGQAETVNALGVAYSRLGQSDDAREQFGKAVELRRALGDRRGVASSLRNLAQLSTVQGRFDEARAQLDEARTLFAAIGDGEGLAAVDNELGLLAEERGDFTGAEAAFRRVLRARQASGDDYGVAESQDNLGFAQFALGDYDSAAVFWQQSLDGFRALEDNEGALRAQQNLGALETARGNWARARQLLSVSLATAERAQMLEETAVSRFYLAQLDLAEGRVGEALSAAQRAGALFVERKDRRGGIDVLLLRAQALLAVGAAAEAERVLAEGSALLAGATAEQRAGAALLRAGLARQRADLAGERDALAAAAKDAAGSGLQVLRLRVAIARGDASPDGFDEDSRRLGNLPVRLEWLQRELERRLDEGDTKAALAAYRLAQEALRGHEQALLAAPLHRLGAQALAAGGDADAAVAARSRSAGAQARVAATLPPSLRIGYLSAQSGREPADGR